MFLTKRTLPRFQKKPAIVTSTVSKLLSIKGMPPWFTLPGVDVPSPLLLLDAWVSQNHVTLNGAWFKPEVRDLMVCELILPLDHLWQNELLGTCRCQFPEDNLGHKSDWSVSICKVESVKNLEAAGYQDVFWAFPQFTIQEGRIKYADTMEGIDASASPSFSIVPPAQTKSPSNMELKDLNAWRKYGILSQLSPYGTVWAMNSPEVSDEFRLPTKPYSIFRV
ncbi:uncharacterized protein EI90DRAFT_3129603 [Cantharellus anzutake]|uniref:uncharacterized protein n=1 Tax=Cantharellus anzutake TaxID=1750568 RepID=UPI0019044699|nr:uncharacterized protein EI90DRAFT_3129603 [Cantharellus anzutake]KAF8324669.1 hypothetical protein EI90DRAFT_3129603 [Cantharellus anzutake]